MDDPKLDEVLDAALRDLPRVDVDELSRARIRRRALDAFSEPPPSRAIVVLERIHAFFVEPALVLGVGTTYLIWAFAIVAGIYRAGS